METAISRGSRTDTLSRTQTETEVVLFRFYLDRFPQQNGDYEVHKENCPYRSPDSRDLGRHLHGHTAMIEARKLHPISNGCLFCCKEIHKD